ncbi:MAG: PilZ domain-containing protein [Acidobacteriota bacterium]
MFERRAVPRVKPAKDLLAKVRGRVPARVVDISSHGAQLEVENTWSPQAVIDVRLQLDDGDIILRGRVCRCRAAGFKLNGDDERILLYRCGVEFDEMFPETMAKLSQHVLYEAALNSVSEDRGRSLT